MVKILKPSTRLLTLLAVACLAACGTWPRLPIPAVHVPRAVPGGVMRLATADAPETGLVSCLAFSADGTRLAFAVTGTPPGRIAIFDLTTGRRLAFWQAHGGVIRSIAFSHDQRFIATAGDDGVVRLWAGDDMQPVAAFDGLAPIAFSTHGRTLATMHADIRDRTIEPALVIRDAPEGRLRMRHDLPNSLASPTDAAQMPTDVASGSAPALGLRWAMSRDRRVLAACGPHTGAVYHTGDVRQFHLGAPGQYEAVALAWHGAVAAFLVRQTPAGHDPHQHISICNTTTAIQPVTIELPTADHRGMCLTPDGQAVACWAGSTVTIYDTTSGKKIRVLAPLESSVSTAAFSPSGKLIAIGDDRGEVIVLDLTHPINAPATRGRK